MVQDEQEGTSGGFGSSPSSAYENLSSYPSSSSVTFINSHDNLSLLPEEDYHNHNQHQHSGTPDGCVYHAVDFPEWKLWSCLLVGSTICLVGTVTNAFLILILLRRNLRHSYMMYLRVLAFLDIVILLSYLAVHSTWVVYDRFQVLWLYIAWTKYVVVFMFLSKSTLVASTYLIVAVSAERLLEVFKMRTGRNANISQKRRWCVVGVLMFFSFAFKMPGFWELEPAEHPNPNCTGFGRYSIRPLLVKNPYYQKYYIGIVDNSVRVVIPFIALIICNGIIIVQWKRSIANENGPMKEAKNQFTIFNDRLLVPTAGAAETVQSTIEAVRQREKEARRRGLKSATKMMLAIVASYLLCNLLNLFITFWEIIDISWLVTNRKLYEMMTDIVTLLTITNASLRLPIYYACNPKIRDEIKCLFMEISNCIDKGAYKEHFPILVRNGGQLISSPGIATDGNGDGTHQNNNNNSSLHSQHDRSGNGGFGYGDHSSAVKNAARVECTQTSITYSTGTTVGLNDSYGSNHSPLRWGESSSPPPPLNGRTTSVVVSLGRKKQNRWASLKSTSRWFGRSFTRIGGDTNNISSNSHINDNTETSLVHTTLTNSMSLPPPNIATFTPIDKKVDESLCRNNAAGENEVCREPNTRQQITALFYQHDDKITGAANDNKMQQVPNRWAAPTASWIFPKHGVCRLVKPPSCPSHGYVLGEKKGVVEEEQHEEEDEEDEEKQGLLAVGNNSKFCGDFGTQIHGGQLMSGVDDYYYSSPGVPVSATNSIATSFMNPYDTPSTVQKAERTHSHNKLMAPVKCSTKDPLEQIHKPPVDGYEKGQSSAVITKKNREKNELIREQQNGLSTPNSVDRWLMHPDERRDYNNDCSSQDDIFDDNNEESLSDPTTIIYV